MGSGASTFAAGSPDLQENLDIVIHKTVTLANNTMGLFNVTVPEGVSPGDLFDIVADGRGFSVRCPLQCGPGDTVTISTGPTPFLYQKLFDSSNKTELVSDNG